MFNAHENLPMPRVTVAQMEADRATAINLFGVAFDALREACAAGGRAAVAKTAIGVSDDAKSALFDGRDKFDWGEHKGRSPREVFIEAMTSRTDVAMWQHVIQATDLERIMDRTARDELRASLAGTPPACTVENVDATLRSVMGEAGTMLQRGIAKAFGGLDRRFRSHDGFKVGGRIVLDRAFSEYGWNYHGRKDEVLRDVERAFLQLDGKEQPERAAGIVGAIETDRKRPAPHVTENEYFRVRRFGNGNAHVWFKRADLVRKVNRVLADYYGEVIAEGSDVAKPSDMGPGYHVTPARNFGLFESPAAVVEKVTERFYGRLRGARVLEPSAGRGRLADAAREAGAASVQCVEIQAELATTLREKGHAVRQGDFLTMTPADLGMFDCIVMNPPFDLGRDCDHVRHALQFLRPGGTLVAVMSASAEVSETSRASTFRAMLDRLDPPGKYGDRRWQDLPAGSFKEAGTMVNTVTLAITTKREG